MEKKTIGTFIAALRKANGLTQKQLAEKLSVSDKAVSRWERDECAPDLTLIPVIAEIFGITTDELLRGERKAAEESPTPYETQKTDKQLRRLLQQAKTNFRIRSIISIAIAMAGLIVALICNNGFLRARIGFFTGAIFYVAAVVCQSIFLILAFSAVQTEELDVHHISSYKKECILFSEGVFTLIVLLFAATVPLSQVDDAYVGLTSYWWLHDGFDHVLAAIVICLVICFLINARLGYQKLPNMKKPLNKLRLRTVLVMAVVLLVSFLAHGLTHSFLYYNMHLYAPGTRYDTWEDLKEFLETPLSVEGEEMTILESYPIEGWAGQVTAVEYKAPDGTIYHTSTQPHVLVKESDTETPKYEYIKRNFSVLRFTYGPGEDHLPIYTYNNEQLIRAENIHSIISLSICAIYPIELAIGIAVYLKKRKALSA